MGNYEINCLLCIFLTGLLYPMDFNEEDNHLLEDKIVDKIASKNKDIISYYLTYDQENSSLEIINLLFEKRSIRRIIMTKLHSNYLKQAENNILCQKLNINELCVFLFFFKIIFTKHCKNKEYKYKLDKKKTNTRTTSINNKSTRDDSYYSDDVNFDETTNISTLSSNSNLTNIIRFKNRKIIDDEDIYEMPKSNLIN